MGLPRLSGKTLGARKINVAPSSNHGYVPYIVMNLEINVPFLKRGRPTEEEEKRCDRCKTPFSQVSAGRPLPRALLWWSSFFGINAGRMPRSSTAMHAPAG